MSNNTPDYENDLAFPPASADVRTTTIEKQLEIAVKALRLYSNLRGDGTVSNYESVAKSALKEIKELDK